MTKVKFYGYDEFGPEVETKLGEIFDRFTVDFPEASGITNYEDDEEMFSITMVMEQEADTFLCEEICHEHEVYCEITEHDGKTSSYYYDEEDEWHTK